MECAAHSGTPAAGTCKVCGKGLCSDCVSRFATPMCEQCLVDHNSEVEKQSIAKLLITAFILVGALLWYVFSTSTTLDGVTFIAFIFVCAYWGRSATKDSDRNMLYGLKTYGLMSIFKFILSIIFGVFLAPLGIYRCIKEIRDVRKLREDMAHGRA